MDVPSDAALHAYYARGEERERLAQSRGVVEFERTKELVLRRLPGPPSVVADIGGGPGRYSLWLAGRGHRVEHRDLVPLHVEQLRAEAGPGPGIRTAVGDARDLDLGDAAVDAVLLLGPLYHCAGAPTGSAPCARPVGWCGPAARCSWPRSPAGRRGWTAC
jgi:SAM-dependent methyltransferase